MYDCDDPDWPMYGFILILYIVNQDLIIHALKAKRARDGWKRQKHDKE
jgi:hypothetical protein